MLKKAHEISFHPFSTEIDCLQTVVTLLYCLILVWTAMSSISPTLIESTVYSKCDR